MTEPIATTDFGAPTTFGAHVFRVEIPSARTAPVVVVEDYGYRGHETGVPQDEERVVLLRRTGFFLVADLAMEAFS